MQLLLKHDQFYVTDKIVALNICKTFDNPLSTGTMEDPEQLRLKTSK